jgi:hypothetical protein
MPHIARHLIAHLDLISTIWWLALSLFVKGLYYESIGCRNVHRVLLRGDVSERIRVIIILEIYRSLDKQQSICLAAPQIYFYADMTISLI